jgi:hypothetical protein
MRSRSILRENECIVMLAIILCVFRFVVNRPSSAHSAAAGKSIGSVRSPMSLALLAWSSPDSTVAILDGQCCFQEIDCERICCRVAYENRGSLTFNGTPGNLLSAQVANNHSLPPTWFDDTSGDAAGDRRNMQLSKPTTEYASDLSEVHVCQYKKVNPV